MASKGGDVIFRDNVVAAVKGRNDYLVTAREYLRGGCWKEFDVAYRIP